MKPHKHAELIKAWADGAEIQIKNSFGDWVATDPLWSEHYEYRIKPKAKVIWIIGPQNVSMPPNMHGFEYRHLFHSNQLIGIENPEINWTKHWWKHVDDPFGLLEMVMTRTR